MIWLTKRKYITVHTQNGDVRATVDKRDYPLLSRHMWHMYHGHVARSVGSNGRRLFMHTLVYGNTKCLRIKHVNGNNLDCRRSNLVGYSDQRWSKLVKSQPCQNR